MVKPEITGNRNTDLLFSKAHRYGLDEKYHMTDIDCLEYGYDKGTPVPLAVMDTKIISYSNNIEKDINKAVESSSCQMYAQLGKALKIPVYVLFIIKEEAIFIAVPLEEPKKDRFKNASFIKETIANRECVLFCEQNKVWKGYCDNISHKQLKKLKTLDAFISCLRNS